MAYYAAARSASIGIAAADGNEIRPGKFDAALDAAAGQQRRCGQDGAWSDRPAVRVAEQTDDPVVAGEIGLHIVVPIDKDVPHVDRPVGDGQIKLDEDEVALGLFDNGGDLDRLGKFFTSV